MPAPISGAKFELSVWSFRGEIVGRRPTIENPESGYWIPGSPALRFNAPE
jgi:hypothetical protein